MAAPGGTRRLGVGRAHAMASIDHRGEDRRRKIRRPHKDQVERGGHGSALESLTSQQPSPPLKREIEGPIARRCENELYNLASNFFC